MSRIIMIGRKGERNSGFMGSLWGHFSTLGPTVFQESGMRNDFD